VHELPGGIAHRSPIPPPVARLAVDRDPPARLSVADPLTDQPQVALLLLSLHTTRRRPSPLAHPSLQIVAVLQRSLESAPSFLPGWGRLACVPVRYYRKAEPQRSGRELHKVAAMAAIGEGLAQNQPLASDAEVLQ